MRYDLSRSSKVNGLCLIWKPVYDFLLVINSNLGSILHRFATIHPWRTDRQAEGQTDDNRDNSSTFTKVRSANKSIVMQNQDYYQNVDV